MSETALLTVEEAAAAINALPGAQPALPEPGARNHGEEVRMALPATAAQWMALQKALLKNIARVTGIDNPSLGQIPKDAPSGVRIFAERSLSKMHAHFLGHCGMFPSDGGDPLWTDRIWFSEERHGGEEVFAACRFPPRYRCE